MNNLKNILIWIVCLLMLASCKECPTEHDPEPDYEVTLSVEEIFCTWVILRVTLPDSGDVNMFRLVRNDSCVATMTCADNDTVITDKGLTPDTEYQYQIEFLKKGKVKGESDILTISSHATSSHSFTWAAEVLGNYGGYLMDAWIVNEDDIWVVGDIKTDSCDYNAAHWNGNEWELLGIYSNTLNLYSIWYFSEDDIWVLASYPIHWNGEQWTHYHLTDMGIIPGGLAGEIWAFNPNDIYFVGRYGRIVHYDGSNFIKMDTETSVRLTDVTASPDGSEIWACGFDDSKGSVLLRKVGNTFKLINEITPLTNLGQPGIISHVYEGIWTCSNRYMFIGATGRLYVTPMETRGETDEIMWWTYTEHTLYPPATHAIDGSGPNDIFVVGNFSLIRHFNGATWMGYLSLYPVDATWFNVSVKDDIVVVVGETDYGQAIVGRGHHK